MWRMRIVLETIERKSVWAAFFHVFLLFFSRMEKKGENARAHFFIIKRRFHIFHSRFPEV